MKIKSYIPNLITLLNLFCGCIALIFVSNFQFQNAFYFICLGIFFDFFDGFFARKFNVQSPLGVQLDSLADMVTSGVLPGYTAYQMLKGFEYDTDTFSATALLGFLITIGACYRLAKFNVDDRQTDSFIGLPTPANCLLIMSLPLLPTSIGHYINFWVLVGIIIFSTYIMNSEIYLFSLKFKKFTIKDNYLPIFFLLSSLVLLLFLGYFGVTLTILLYIVLSVVTDFFAKKVR
jgi:CDP-diacylglycerol---serine O-phosphatidyltransferase